MSKAELFRKVNTIKSKMESYDSNSTVTLKEEELGYRLKQTLSDGIAGVMLYFSFKDDGEVTFNHGWKMDTDYLGEICDFLIEILKSSNLPIGDDGFTLYHKSKSYQKDMKNSNKEVLEMTEKHFISSDENANETLKEELGSLRGGILGAANKNPLPEIFSVKPHSDKPKMIITNTENGKTTEVPLFAYGAIRKALNDLH